MKKQKINFTRITNDVNGNPRYVVHFLDLLNNKEINEAGHDLDKKYEMALTKARTLGGKKFHNKQFGGGVVFQSYNTRLLEESIIELRKS